MTTAVDAMHTGDICIGQSQSLLVAIRLMRDREVGALPVWGDDDRLHGIITDLDTDGAVPDSRATRRTRAPPRRHDQRSGRRGNVSENRIDHFVEMINAELLADRRHTRSTT